MRDDMAKVIVERPRHGGGVKYPRGSAWATDRLPVDEWHRREAMKRPWQHTSCPKRLNENLAPLRRFLRSRVGRPWDKVYAEICERINRRSAVQLHIWQHLVQYVCADPQVITGEVRGWMDDFYVDPRTNLLRAVRREPRARRQQLRLPETVEVVAVDDDRCFRRIDRVWYEVTVRDAPLGGAVWDAALQRRLEASDRAAFRRYRGRPVYAAAKRQLSQREIRRLHRTAR